MRTLCLILALAVLAACAPAPAATPLAATVTRPAPTAEATPVALPEITSVTADRNELGRYDSVEWTVTLDARYNNPYDQREVRLDALMTGPGGTEWVVPGFWDGEAAWRVRFTPGQAGDWAYRMTVTDERGTSPVVEGQFQVAESDRHGWLQVGAWVDPAYSSRYLVYHDGTPFYGIGHCDPLKIFADGVSAEGGVGLFDEMLAAGENYVVWWPLYSNSPINLSYDDYNLANLKVIDLVVQDAQRKGIFLVFTVWDHPQLRGVGHPWGGGNWQSNNGFRKLGDLNDFFTSDEAWAWQENFYRYTIARWGYSPAIGLWQTVSEINGTNAYNSTDSWHQRVNDYFVANDPYRHPTTASKSGDVDWTAGWADMDIPQVHVYELDDATLAGDTLAGWTARMAAAEAKPNWIGEFGVPGNLQYPEMFHNSIWGALGAGAALTPAEWNDRGGWGEMTPAMLADLQRLAQFVAPLPLAHWDPQPVQVTSNQVEVRAWGVLGEPGGLVWVQDAALDRQPIDVVRADTTLRSGVTLSINEVPAGEYTLTPYDTWQGLELEPVPVTCAGGACDIPLPDFARDLAVRIVKN